MGTKIEWTDESWNPVTGCSKASAGCLNCWAEGMSKRLRGRYGYPKDDPFRVTLHPDRLDEPLKWKKPRMVFVVSMGDLLHPDVPDVYLERVFKTIDACPKHRFLVLTKRPERMQGMKLFEKCRPNVWLGVTAENQIEADRRLPLLIQKPAVVHYVSCEPFLGPMDLEKYIKGLDWVIVGSESGRKARPMNEDWVRKLRDQCRASGTAFFYKQRLDARKCKVSLPELDGRRWKEFPKLKDGQK